LISDRVKFSKTLVFTLIGFWFIAMIGATILGVSIAKNFTRDIEFTDKKSFEVSKDTLTIKFSEFKNSGKYKFKWFDNDDMGGFISFDGNVHRRIENDIHIQQTKDSLVSVEIQYHAKGRNMDNARENAEQIQYNYKMNAQGELEFDDFIILPEGSKFRDQDVEIFIYIPEGTTLNTENVEDVEYYGENDYYNSYNGNNKFIKFVNGQPECSNCGSDEFEDEHDRVVHLEFDSGGSSIKVSPEGVRMQDGNDKIIIDNKIITAADGTDSVNINSSSNGIYGFHKQARK